MLWWQLGFNYEEYWPELPSTFFQTCFGASRSPFFLYAPSPSLCSGRQWFSLFCPLQHAFVLSDFVLSLWEIQLCFHCLWSVGKAPFNITCKKTNLSFPSASSLCCFTFASSHCFSLIAWSRHCSLWQIRLTFSTSSRRSGGKNSRQLSILTKQNSNVNVFQLFPQVRMQQSRVVVKSDPKNYNASVKTDHER